MNQFLDVRALPCPQTIAQAKKIIKAMHPGDMLTVWLLDDITLVDFKSFCQLAQHELLEVIRHNDFYEIKITI